MRKAATLGPPQPLNERAAEEVGETEYQKRIRVLEVLLREVSAHLQMNMQHRGPLDGCDHCNLIRKIEHGVDGKLLD